MEVHAHSHTARKKLSHYFWEFLMLFLAVFCGYVAEFRLEHKIEKDRAQQYLFSLYEDLKADTVRLSHVINWADRKIAALSDMSDCYDTVSKNIKASTCIGNLVSASKTNRTFWLTDRTLRQLANAGGFRLLPKQDADSILDYEASFKQYKDFESTIFQQAQDNVRNTLNSLADFRIYKYFQSTAVGLDTAGIILTEPILFSDDRLLINKYFNEMLLYLRVTTAQKILLVALRTKAMGLLEYYKSKYHYE